MNARFSAVWDGVLRQALYEWGWLKSLCVLLLFSASAALLAALWFSIAGWQALPEADKAIFLASDFLFMLSAYAVLFLMLNTGASLLYVTLMGGFIHGMGRYGHMRTLSFPQAWKLALLSGMVPLAIVLVFGQVLQLSFGLALVLMLVHGLWLRTLDLPQA